MRIKPKYYPLCPCWTEPGDPEGTIGTCEGTGGECVYPEKEEIWISCEHLSTGCKQCKYSPACGYNKREDEIRKIEAITVKKEAIKSIFEQ